MIHYVEGPVVLTKDDRVVIQGQGFGWSIHMTRGLSERLEKDADGSVRIFTYLHVREDLLALYGFPTQEDEQLFEILIGVTGVGPKLGQLILDQLSPDRFALAIMNSDVKQLTQVKGLGKKTAERLILELKDKLEAPEWLTGLAEELPAHPDRTVDESFTAVLEALGVLGFAGKEAADIAARYYEPEEPIDVNVRRILQQVGLERKDHYRR